MPRIAIPIAQSRDEDYVARAMPQYEQAIVQAGGEPVRVPLDRTPAEVMKIIERCDGVLLPGSAADVDPAKYGAPSDPKTAPPDSKRDTVDELLLQDAYNMRKPVLAICYGLQILNVYRSGTLVQHVPDWLPAEKSALINHEAGRKIAKAHNVEIEPESRLAEIVKSEAITSTFSVTPGKSGEPQLKPAPIVVSVNSSHHQAADVIGDGLRTVARCAEDGVTEAIEGTTPGHWVLGVQWHPERSVADDAPSRAIFRAFVEEARATHGKLVGEFERV